MEKEFNTHLEKCWAIFFDELQINYTYNPKGFENIEDINFYLNDMDTYVKVVFMIDDITELDIRKYDYFSDNGNINILWIVGCPTVEENEVRMFLLNKYTFYSLDWIKENIPNDSNFIKEFKGFLEFTDVDFAINPFNGEWTLSYYTHRPDYYDYQYILAMRKAKQAYLDYTSL